MNNCIFCQENRFVNNLKVGFTLSESLIYENEYIFVTPDLSPLVSGHLLIVSQNHYNSFAEAPVKVQDALQREIEYIHNNLYCEKITWFEHGAVFPGKGGASIDHAHLHVLPYDLPVQKAVEADDRFSKKVPFSKDIFHRLAKRQPYLWISNGFDSSSIYYVDILPSQYLRDVVMNLQGRKNYNWKSNFMKEESIRKYKETLEKIHLRGI